MRAPLLPILSPAKRASERLSITIRVKEKWMFDLQERETAGPWVIQRALSRFPSSLLKRVW